MEEIYSLRKSFSVIGITGRMGSGCLKFAQIISASQEAFFGADSDLRPYLRTPESITDSESVFNIFKRKYNICYNFVFKNWINYEVIDYKKALVLYCIDFYKNKPEPLIFFVDMLFSLYKKSEEHDKDFPEILLDKAYLIKKLSELRFDSIISNLKLLQNPITDIKTNTDLDILYNLYFSKTSAFNDIYNLIINYLSETNHYLRTFLFHKIANNIRSTGNPSERDKSNGQFIYTVAKTINRLIKSYKNERNSQGENCHLVINSLKNSLEIMFFKERYSAFYMAAIHNGDHYKQRIKTQITHDNHIEQSYHKLLDVHAIEYKSESFSEGEFFAPDIQNCIQKSEIHINNNVIPSNEPDFITLNEQAIKYIALIQQPGIITPSAVERCMQVAFNSKLNSGCISRQVGAVITDKGYSIKAVGWNDVPQGSTPCLLRNINELTQNHVAESAHEKNSSFFNTYSEFELTTDEAFYYQLNPNKENSEFIQKTFNQNMQLISNEQINRVTEKGKNCSFCFKAHHNKFEAKNNQVHTRSLHAEENAMLQIAKHGGQPLIHGILFTTASPCELCSKKAYQLGVSTIIYIDPYPGISTSHILNNGFKRPDVTVFKGVIGKAYNKLYEPFISYKDELKLMMKAPPDTIN